MGRFVIPTLFALAASIPAPGHGTDYVIRIQGHVPLTCRATLDAGTLHEFCNSGSGYRVYAAPSSELVGATLLVDGVRKALVAGEVLVSASPTAAIINRAVAIEGASSGSLSLRIEAI